MERMEIRNSQNLATDIRAYVRMLRQVVEEVPLQACDDWIINKGGLNMREIWKPVVGYEAVFEVNNFGNVLDNPELLEEKYAE